MVRGRRNITKIYIVYNLTISVHVIKFIWFNVIILLD